jgi:hypothetical protein
MSIPSQSYDDPSIDMSADMSFSNPNGQPISPARVKVEVDGDADENGLDSSIDSSGYSGYLYKMTRDGRWQRRWFETNGVFLTYYKSRKREKLLAALSLPQVGQIDLKQYGPHEEKKPGTFTMELQSRVYTLRARNDEEAMLWIKVLRKLKASKPEDVATTLSPMSMAMGDDFRDSTVFDPRGSALSVSSLSSASLSISSNAEGTWEKQSKSSRCIPCF